MFDLDNGGTPLFVLIGIVVAQLFLYGRKVRERVKIAVSDVVSDLMQFGVMFIVCMAFLTFARSIVGWNLHDPWQMVTVVILFNMSFDTWFNRIREAFNTKVGAAFDVLMGRKVAVDEDDLPHPAGPTPIVEAIASPVLPAANAPHLNAMAERLDAEIDNHTQEDDKGPL
jgi:hypothetical protein